MGREKKKQAPRDRERETGRIDWESESWNQRVGIREGASASKRVTLQVREHAFVSRRAPWPS